MVDETNDQLVSRRSLLRSVGVTGAAGAALPGLVGASHSSDDESDASTRSAAPSGQQSPYAEYEPASEWPARKMAGECKIDGEFAPPGMKGANFVVKMCDDIFTVGVKFAGQQWALLEMTEGDASGSATTYLPVAPFPMVTVSAEVDWENGTAMVSIEWCVYTTPIGGGWHCVDASQSFS